MHARQHQKARGCACNDNGAFPADWGRWFEAQDIVDVAREVCGSVSLTYISACWVMNGGPEGWQSIAPRRRLCGSHG